jgi:exosome complex RNA-binding protein Csl4
MNVEKLISPLIASQFPSFYKTEGPNFIAFVKAYYEWAEQQNNFLQLSRSLYDIKDIDSTPAAFIKYFKNKYISSLPESIISDKTLLVKHILDLYRSKGSERAYELLFRILFNEEISFYIPGQFIFKPSEANWVIPTYIEVSNHPLLTELVGRKIYTKKDGFAVVENYFTKIFNNKTVNILTLSNLNGNFKFNEQIFCEDLPQITSDNAPIIFGSLSSVSITNGGSGFKIGDLLNVTGGGFDGIARVAVTTNQNGKVSFNLVDGGYGFSVNAIVTVTGGGGAGASFQVGDITNKQAYLINQDVLSSYYNTEMDISSSGFSLGISNSTGTFQLGEKVTAANVSVIDLDVTQISLTAANGESFSNSSLGISGLVAYKVDGNSLSITGSNTNLTNANLVSGVVLKSNTSHALVKVNTVYPVNNFSANGIVVSANTSTVVVNQVNNYFVPGTVITGNVHSYTANVTSDTRLTDWLFPYSQSINKKANLDSKISDILTLYILEAGTITYLKNVNPGLGYSSNPTISIIEPAIYDLKIPDGNGGYYGYDAVVTSTAGSANGIAAAVQIVNSGYGYNPDETVYLSNNTNPTSVTGVAVVDLNGIGTGSWTDNKSFISDTINIQDSYYYQNFSYEIVAPRMFETYESLVKNLIHPSGIALFGSYALNSYITDSTIAPETFSVIQS